MKLVKINKDFNVLCECKSRRNGFKHIATLFRNGSDVDEAKALYINRTWEQFRYDTVIKKLIYKTIKLNDKQKKSFLRRYFDK